MDLILLAAGSGSRTGLQEPKQMLKLDNKPILYHLLDFFIKISTIEDITIVTSKDLYNIIKHLETEYCNVKIVLGGETRQESVLMGLMYVKTKEVIIHEVARPFINYELVGRLFDCPNRPSVPCIKSVNTLYNLNDAKYVDRDYIVNIQLPQIYYTRDILKAHILAIGNNRKYTDDSSLIFYELGIKPNFVDGSDLNIKITTPFDIELARFIYEKNNCNRRE